MLEQGLLPIPMVLAQCLLLHLDCAIRDRDKDRVPFQGVFHRPNCDSRDLQLDDLHLLTFRNSPVQLIHRLHVSQARQLERSAA